jgi:hypothetical protein
VIDERREVIGTMRRVAVGIVVGWMLIGACCASARGDGGTLRLSQRAGAYDVAVFTAPTPFRAGPVDISVLVHDAATKEPVPEARVTVSLKPKDGLRPTFRVPATTAAATNKLLRAAVFDLPEPGTWEADVAIEGSQGSAQVHLELVAARPFPKWMSMWPWLSWPLVVVLLYGIHQYLVWRKTR